MNKHPRPGSDPGRFGAGQLVSWQRLVAWRIREDRCTQVAGSLTYTTLLALVPLVAVVLAVASAFPWFKSLTLRLDDFLLANMLPETVGRTVLRYVDQFTQRAGRLTAIGLGLLALTAGMLMVTIEREFNQIFGVRRGRPLPRRVLLYGAVIVLGPVLMGLSISMTSYLVTESLGYTRGLPYVGDTLLRAGPVLITVLALSMLYYLVPCRRIAMRHAFAGGFAAGMLFELMRRGFALYVTTFPTYSVVYGAFAAVPVFLLWLYLSWLVVITGCSLTALFSGFHERRPERALPGMELLDARAVLEVLVGALRGQSELTLWEIAARAGPAPETCDRLLAKMEAENWVEERGDDCWRLVRRPESISVADLVRLFHLDPRAGMLLAERWPEFGIARAGDTGRPAVS